jgi:DNA-directed RNA polymerase subunit RPC12/RpoP
MGLFGPSKPAEKPSKPAEQPQEPQGYKCLSCGTPLKGMVLFCPGCSGYLCRSCGIPNDPEDSSKYSCPNCSSECQFFTL